MEDPLDMIMAEKEVEPELLTYGMHTSNPDPRIQGLISYWTNKGNTKKENEENHFTEYSRAITAGPSIPSHTYSNITHTQTRG